MRNALILLAVVALIILVAGAFNNGVVFDIDYVAGTASSVSLFWVSLVIAAIVFVAGLAAAWFALSGAKGGRRKLEAELQSTYERLRETERDAEEARSAAAASAAAAAAALAAPPEATVVAEREEATVVLADAPTVVEDEAQTVLIDEETSVVVDEEATVVVDEEPAAVAGEAAAAEATAQSSSGESAGEQTAVTVVEIPADDGAAPAVEETVVAEETAAEDAPPQEADAGDAPGAKE